MKKTAIFLMVLAFLMSSCMGKQKYHFDKGEIFHTYYHIKYEAEQNLSDTIMAELNKFNHSLNPFMPHSVISDVNNNVPVEVDSFFVKVFERAMYVSECTDGMFDITCAPLVNLWGFGFENIDRVDSLSVDSLLQFVGYSKVRLLSDNTVEKDDARLKLNMSAIAKGYAVDVVCALLERFGVQNYMCEIGGEICAKGVNPQGECWNIGINKPIDDASGTISEIALTIPLCNMSIATSGNYRNFYEKDGVKYAHTINPKTGYPSLQSILSATVLTPDCMSADAYATAFMAMGMDASKDFLAKNPDFLTFFIYADENGDIKNYFSPAFAEMFGVE